MKTAILSEHNRVKAFCMFLVMKDVNKSEILMEVNMFFLFMSKFCVILKIQLYHTLTISPFCPYSF